MAGDKRPGYGADAVFGKAGLRFDGADDELHFASSSEINLQTVQARSLGLVFSTGSVGDTQVVFEEGGGWAGLNVVVAAGQLHANIWTGSDYATLSVDVTADTDYALALSFDGEGGSWSLALNGVSVTTETELSELGQHGQAAVLGNATGSTVFWHESETKTEVSGDFDFDGAIAKLAMTSDALTEAELIARITPSNPYFFCIRDRKISSYRL